MSHKKLPPAFYNLNVDGVLGPKFAVVGFSMETPDDEKYLAAVNRSQVVGHGPRSHARAQYAEAASGKVK